MADYLTSPIVAFALYVVGGALILAVGRVLAGAAHPSAAKTGIYASGEAPPRGTAMPGYRGFFVAALFFAVLHLGALMIASRPPSLATAAYLIGLAVTLLAMLFGERQSHDNPSR
jgi:NADH:ubiquinone oxidoreductase subunit 3 (subunit A)